MELAFTRWGQIDPPGHPDRQKITFLHGMGGTGKLWRPIAAFLEKDFEILALDQRAHGASRPPAEATLSAENFTPLAYGQDVVETLLKHAFHPTWIVGHSMGVRTSVAAAHLRPDLVRGLLLIDLGFHSSAGGGLGDRLGRFIRVLPSRFESRAQARAFMDTECPDSSIAQYLMAVGQVAADGSVTFPFDHDGLLRTIEAAKGSTLRAWVRDLATRHQMPVLAIRGETSSVWTREEFNEERRLFQDLPTVEFAEVAGAGHGVPYEKRTEFLRLLTEWIERNS